MNAPDAIAHALEDLLTGRESFTLYDVTKHARSFTSDNVKYYDVRSYVVPNMHQEDDYNIESVNVEDINGHYVSAMLYINDSNNVSDYDQNAIQTDKSLVTPVAAVAATGCCGGNPCAAPAPTILDKAKAAAKAASDLVKKFQGNTGLASPAVPLTSAKDLLRCKVDTYGRVMIPSKFIKRLGLDAGDTVHSHVTTVKGLLVLAPIHWSDKSATHLNAYVIDCYCNVKISKRIIAKSNTSISVDSCGRYVNVRSEDNRIVIGE